MTIVRSARFAQVAAVIIAMGLPAISRGQSLLDRTPNVSGDWTGAPGTLYFHFVHRFTASDAPERKVSSVPTFLLAAGLPKRLMAGFNYSTNSALAPRFPNEWELFGRWLPLAQDFGDPLDIGAQVGYNNASDGVDAELSASRRFGRLRLLAAGRALSDPDEANDRRYALAGGATIRLSQYVALAGDVGSLTDRDSTERVAWSAGLHFAIPLTPHTVSLHATNAMITTLQGASRGTSNVRYGFEFTIPLTLRRYFGKRAAAASEPDSAAPVAVPVVVIPAPAKDSVRAPAVVPPLVTAPAPTMPPTAPRPARVMKTTIKNVSYLQPRLQVTVGTTVEWTNNDPMPHSVTAIDKSFNSGLINPGRTYRHTFTKAGTFSFYCIPHPFMKGTIVVREP